LNTTRKWIALTLAMAIMLGGTALLTWLHTHQKLGPPAVKTVALADSRNLEVQLPERVLDYMSEKVPVDDLVLNFLPGDTSYGQRRYVNADGAWTLANVVLMGADRTSIHKAQYCLQGQGWTLDPAPSAPTKIPIDRPYHYDLPVIKVTGTRDVLQDGRKVRLRGIYVYWYVADGVISADSTGTERMWLMSRELIRSGVLQRWAYVSYFSICLPGQEEATFERTKRLIAASVPEFQLTPHPKEMTKLTAPQ
jgi:hypothetical protein